MPGLAEMMEGAQKSMTVRRVYGDPIEREGTTVIPVATVSGGGGGGEGTEAEQQGSGAGYGVRARPVGVYVVREGKVSWKPAFDVVRISLAGIAFAALLTWVIGRIIRRD